MHNYWNKIYSNKNTDELGWYENNPVKSLELISRCNLKKHDKILLTGAGTTLLVDKLLDLGYENIIATDISSKAMELLKLRLGEARSVKVKWITDDIANPEQLCNINGVKLWFDRAVLHFLTEADQRKAYFDLLRKIVSDNGFVILAQFSTKTVNKCSGLNVYRYNIEMLQNELGSGFTTVDSFEYDYIMPSGDVRNYIYGLFGRNNIIL